MTRQPRRPETEVLHPEPRREREFAATTTPIHHASTVVFPSVAAMRARDWEAGDYTYGLAGTPTARALEQRLALIEGAEHCLLAPSGLSAITLADLAFLRAGDALLLPHNVYHPSREFANSMLAGLAVACDYYDPMDAADLAAKLSPRTRLVWFESPGSITMEVPDLGALVGVVREANATREDDSRVLTAIDNTWSAGLALKPFDLGIDLSMQALTKYQSGGSDVLMGALLTRDPALHRALRLAHARLGLGVGADAVYLVLRGMKSLVARFERHDASARRVAQWCQGRRGIARVLHPALPDAPGHANWSREFTGAGGLFSVVFDARHDDAAAARVVDALTLFPLGYSWGGATSLSMVYAAGRTPTLGAGAGPLLRLNIGLEDPGDLIADLEQALRLL